MAVTNDTTSKTINGKDGTADFVINNISYKCILDMFRCTSNVEMLTADTFCNEGSTDQEPGRDTLSIEISGVGKKGGPASGPLLPPPQDVPIIATYSAGCTITTQMNFTQADAVRMVNQNMRISGRGVNKGPYVVVWDRGED